MTGRMAILVVMSSATVAPAADWPGWRGPSGDGTVVDAGVPLRWSANEHVAWKVPIPGVGHSSPIVWGRRIFVTTCVDNDRLLICMDRDTGRELWRTTVLTAHHELMHKNNTPASSTPVTDGKRVWVTFLDGDAIAVASLDVDTGRKVWQRQFPGFVSPHGFCGSPVLHESTVIVNGDSDGEAFLAALDRATGDVRWQVPRPNRTRSFSAPIFVDVGGTRQMVLAGSKSVVGFDPNTGVELWVVDSPTDKFTATPVYACGLVVATGTSPVSTLTAIRPDGRGNVTRTHVAWSISKSAAYVPSLLAIGDNVFVQTDGGLASYVDARTGKIQWTERLGRHHHASPLLINGMIYSLADDGTMFVVQPGPKFRVVARNSLGEDCNATPAVSAGCLFVRSTQHLWCIRTGG
jgi:outer membrane protein assembly factor BamB